MTRIVISMLLILGIMTVAQSNAYANSTVFNVNSSTGGTTGTLETFSNAQSALEFYNLGNFSANPAFSLTSGGVHLFIHHDTSTDIYSLGAIIDSRDDGSGGRLRGTISGFPLSAVVALSDDPGEVVISTPGTVSVNARWFNCCTDGFIVSGIDPNNLNVTFDFTTVQGLDTFVFTSPTGFSSAPLGTGTVGFAVSTAPEPATWAMMILGFLGVAFQLKRQRRAHLASTLSYRPFKPEKPYFSAARAA